MYRAMIHAPAPLKSKMAVLAMISMVAAWLRGRDMEGFCDNPYPYFEPHDKKGNSH